jgi:hypothetical protein
VAEQVRDRRPCHAQRDQRDHLVTGLVVALTTTQSYPSACFFAAHAVAFSSDGKKAQI